MTPNKSIKNQDFEYSLMFCFSDIVLLSAVVEKKFIIISPHNNKKDSNSKTSNDVSFTNAIWYGVMKQIKNKFIDII